MKENLSVYEFITLARNGHLGELDIDNYIEDVTHKYQKAKLEKLLSDIELYLNIEREEMESRFSEKDVLNALQELNNAKKETPYKTIREINLTDKDGKLFHSPEFKVLNFEKLLFPFEFFEVYTVIAKLKNYLNGNFEKALPMQIFPKKGQGHSRTRQIIFSHLEALDKNKGWEYAFSNEPDFNKFLDLLSCYFEFKPYTLPEQIIMLKKDCKTRFAKALSPIHKELSSENKKLRSDKEFFKIVKTLSHFKDLTDNEIYQAITR